MNKEFENISEAVLFDNLKRSANKWLRKLNEEKDPIRKLENFIGKYPTIIQALLRDVGKQFFKIFLYECIKNKLIDGNYTNYKKEDILKNTVKNFRFYFYPGYTTVNGNRIFMLGNKKNDGTDDRYFTGIGNTFLEVENFENIFDYLNKSTSKPNYFFNYKNEFWIDDIPSTVALDNLLNQFYIDKEMGNNIFNSPSTHYWKSMQKREDGIYIPMPLKNDNSELRILKVSIGNKKFNYGNNQIEIFIKPTELLESGKKTFKYLSRQKIPIDWQKDSDKNNYIPWPYIKDKIQKGALEDKNIELQLMAYSFWITETLNATNNSKISYSNFRKAFAGANLKVLGDKIHPFQKHHKGIHGFTEIYYNHWYTLFLESFSKEVDLGTSMFLTSDEYAPEFLMKCTNWIRWIYNELRLIEATAKKFIDTQRETHENDFRSIKHHLNSLVSANNFLIKSKNGQSLSTDDIQLLSYLSSNMFSFINLNFDEGNQIFDEINLNYEIETMLKCFKIVSENNHIYSKIFGRHIDEKFFDKHEKLKYLKFEFENVFIKNVPTQYFKLLIKDLLENLIKHSDLANPDCSIKIAETDEFIEIISINSIWPDPLTLERMNDNSFSSTQTGWRNIMNCIKNTDGWGIELPDGLRNKKEVSKFEIKIKIKK